MNIFNCVNKSNCSNTYDELQGNHILFSSDMVVHAQEIIDIISKLPSGKSPGPDEISSEHLKYAGMKLPIMLSLLISASLMHGYLPCSFMTSVIVPVIKEKNKRISDKDNYRPICLPNVHVNTKVLERLLHFMCDGF